MQVSTLDPTSASLTLSQGGHGHISGTPGFAGHDGDTDTEQEVRRMPRLLPQSRLPSGDTATSGFTSQEKRTAPSSLKEPVFSCVQLFEFTNLEISILDILDFLRIYRLYKSETFLLRKT